MSLPEWPNCLLASQILRSTGQPNTEVMIIDSFFHSVLKYIKKIGGGGGGGGV